MEFKGHAQTVKKKKQHWKVGLSGVESLKNHQCGGFFSFFSFFKKKSHLKTEHLPVQKKPI